jgi:hydroxymethylbilane synthase
MRIGTRGSTLAVAQAESVAQQLPGPTEVVTITTLGDRGAAELDKSRWVSELERALVEDRIDIAVHSAKDVPTELPAGLKLVAVPARADARDVLCGAASLQALNPGARVGTSSVRRAAQLHAARPDLEVVGLRGNVDTRLHKLAEGQVDALVLALAGLQRLERTEEAGGTLDEFIPAAGQGALALEACVGRIDSAALGSLNDPVAMECVVAERALVHALGASCNTPVGAHCRMLAEGELELAAWVGLPDGSAWLNDRVRGARANDRVSRAGAEVGVACAERMLAAGAADLLREAERVLAA